MEQVSYDVLKEEVQNLNASDWLHLLDLYVMQNSSTIFSYHFQLEEEKQKLCFEKIESVIQSKALDLLIACKESEE